MANTIKGLDTVLAQLESLKQLEFTKAALAGALTLQKYSMENSPVKTGFLRASHESVETENGAEMRVNANYSYYLEFGTKKRPAHSFVRKAVDEHSTEIVEAIKNEIENQIKARL
jgi:HK97 gp10 family phage protein